MNISKERLIELHKAELQLLALHSAGVDCWDYYDEAMEIYQESLQKEGKSLDIEYTY